MQSSIHARHAHAEPRDHAQEPIGLSSIGGVLRRRRTGRHGTSAGGATVRRLGVGVLAVSLSTGLLGGIPGATAASGDHGLHVGTLAASRTVTAPAGATFTLQDLALPQVVLPPPPAPAPPPPPPAPPSPAQIKQYAASLVGAGQFGCLDKLWNRESSWNPAARNPSSGAFGIPQSLPGSKMASAGADWQTNPLTQVRWGVDYIKRSYGSPCGAWAHSQATGWY